VEMFTEKPDIETAESFLADGRYFWNSGMFIWRADRFLDEVGRQLPEIGVALSDVRSTPRDAAFTHELEAYYGSVPSISVDYGVMEGAGEVLVVPTRFSWDDVGAWSALGRVWTSNARGNSVRGDSLLIDSHGCVVYSEGGVVAVVGLSDVVVAHTPGATLVCPQERARDVRRVVEELKRRGSIEDAES
jgi:mannose-1-phosphate guanylyltransferase